MPTFPTYRGELPKCLNPLSLRHYFLLAYWVYFRPTALKCYLYQADPDLYCAGPGLGIFRTLRVPAYRNLYLTVPGVIVLFSVLVGVPIRLVISWIPGVPLQPQWLGVESVAFALIFAIAFAMIVSASASVASSVAGSVAGGAVGIATFSVAFGIAFMVTLESVLGMYFIATGRIHLGASFSAAAGVAFGVAFGAVNNVAFAVAVTMAVIAGLSMPIGRQIVRGFAPTGMIFGVGFGIGVLRVPFYPFQLAAVLYNMLRGRGHPFEWDELTIIPLPGTHRALLQRLRGDEPDGMQLAANISRNSFRRYVAQRVLQAYLHEQPAPIRFLYTLLTYPALDSYVRPPTSKEAWVQGPSIRKLLLGELNTRWVECHHGWINRLFEYSVWYLTWLLRDRRRTPLTRFAGMLYELLDKATVAADKFDLGTYAGICADLTGYLGGHEIAHSFAAMAAFLCYDNLSALPASVIEQDVILGYGDTPIRPKVLTALTRLGQIGTEIATYRDATSRINQLSALARATAALDTLDEYVVAEVMAPEQYILRRIIRQWRRLVSEAGGQVGRAEEIKPVTNPYVAGNPVTGDLFMGREDILRRLEELWSGVQQCPSVVLYGHRRMGKSSILHNLGARFGPHTVIVDFNMQRVGLVKGTGELLYNLALALYDAQTAETGFLGRNLVSLDEPAETQFTTHSPYTAFDRFLKRLDRVRADHRFIVTVDEFELIERMIAEGQLEPRLLDFWRGLIQTYPWFVMTFAGLHTLQEMTRDYWHPLYGSVIGIPVSFLSVEAARRLLTQPTPDFPLDYDRDAVEYIITLTHGQPYLVQLIGHGLVTRFNRQTFEEGVERERRLTLVDVEAVISAPEFYRDGDAYFTGVWRQAETSQPSGQTAVLHVLAQPEVGTSVEEVARQAGLVPEVAGAALEALARHDVAMEEGGQWKFTIELMRRWVEKQETRFPGESPVSADRRDQ